MTLPNFLIIGALKAGTTSLFNYLGQHPQVYRSALKEPRYFAYDPSNPDDVNSPHARFPVRTLADYEELFAGATDEPARGEASPVYFGSLYAMQSIQETLPDVRLILCLREPVSRLYSQFLMNARSGLRSDDPYLECSPEGQLAQDNRYSPRVALWLERFDRAQIGVTVLEKLRQSPVSEVQAQYAFLGVDPTFVPTFTTTYNVGGVPKSRQAQALFRFLKAVRRNPLVRRVNAYLPDAVGASVTAVKQSTLTEADPLPDDLAAELRAFYRDDVLELQELLGIDLSIWGYS